MSNTSKGKAIKGSKLWMQILANIGEGKALTKEIQSIDNSIEEIEWLSPLRSEEYIEYSLNNKKISELLGISNDDMKFWPLNQPQWDGIGITRNKDNSINQIILLEAKAHLDEIKSSCQASDGESLKLIKETLKETYRYFTGNDNFNEEIWIKRYYQLGNRLAFLYKLKENGYNVKLILLNIVGDFTYKMNTQEEWDNYYKQVFYKMLGTIGVPENVDIVNVIV